MIDLLLVDDDDDGAYLLAELLGTRGYQVRRAANGEEGLRRFDERFPQVVISDVEMPVLDGPAMVYRLFIENLGRENVPLVLLSGRSDLADIADAVGTPYYLTKPFDFPEMVSLLERATTEAIPPRPAEVG